METKLCLGPSYVLSESLPLPFLSSFVNTVVVTIATCEHCHLPASFAVSPSFANTVVVTIATCYHICISVIASQCVMCVCVCDVICVFCV